MAFSLITLQQPKSSISEAFRTLRTNVQFTGVDKQTKTILVTSTGPNEGKSTVISNLAVSMVNAGESVLLIDADMRKPTLQNIFLLNNGEGLSSALIQGQNYLAYIKKTRIPGLNIMTSGPIPPNPAELLGSKRMEKLLEEIGDQFDRILIDTPPVIAVTDAAVLSRVVDGVILVLASGESNREYALRAKEQLDKVGANILGAVLNKIEMQSNNYYYNYYHSIYSNDAVK